MPFLRKLGPRCFSIFGIGRRTDATRFPSWCHHWRPEYVTTLVGLDRVLRIAIATPIQVLNQQARAGVNNPVNHEGGNGNRKDNEGAISDRGRTVDG